MSRVVDTASSAGQAVQPRATASAAPSPTEADLLAMKVSAILESQPDSLEVLITHGFAPLKQPHLRAVLSHTVTLAQALRIRSMAHAHERALLDALLAVFLAQADAGPVHGARGVGTRVAGAQVQEAHD